MRKCTYFLIIAVIVLLSSLFFACEWVISGDYFEYKLRGTWVSNSNSYYGVTLEIGYTTIIISDRYSYSDFLSPFKDIIRGPDYTGYSDGENIYIDTTGKGDWKIFPYEHIKPGNSIQSEYLTIWFGLESHTLVKQ